MGLDKKRDQIDHKINLEVCQCIICHNEINIDSYYNTRFGRCGLVVKDMFNHNSKIHHMKLQFK